MEEDAIAQTAAVFGLDEAGVRAVLERFVARCHIFCDAEDDERAFDTSGELLGSVCEIGELLAASDSTSPAFVASFQKKPAETRLERVVALVHVYHNDFFENSELHRFDAATRASWDADVLGLALAFSGPLLRPRTLVLKRVHAQVVGAVPADGVFARIAAASSPVTVERGFDIRTVKGPVYACNSRNRTKARQRIHKQLTKRETKTGQLLCPLCKRDFLFVASFPRGAGKQTLAVRCTGSGCAFAVFA